MILPPESGLMLAHVERLARDKPNLGHPGEDLPVLWHYWRVLHRISHKVQAE
jgi:hypothetical protein